VAVRIRRRLVIDSDVMRAAGREGTISPVARECRLFLEAVLSICHGMALSGELYEEWRRHLSAYAREWRISMVGRKKLAYVGDVSRQEFRHAISSAAATERQRRVMLKDDLLIEAAIAADRIVISCDNEARDLFGSAVNRIPNLCDIAWVNPTEHHDNVLQWLQEGAKPRPDLLLGFSRK